MTRGDDNQYRVWYLDNNTRLKALKNAVISGRLAGTADMEIWNEEANAFARSDQTRQNCATGIELTQVFDYVAKVPPAVHLLGRLSVHLRWRLLSFLVLGLPGVTSVASAQPLTVVRENVLARRGAVVLRIASALPAATWCGQGVRADGWRARHPTLQGPFPRPAAARAPARRRGGRILNAARAPVWTYSPTDQDPSDFWSGDIPGASATIEVISVADGARWN